MAHHTELATVLSPSEAISGFSQAQLGDEWWKTIYSIPVDQHFGVFDDSTDSRGRRGSTEKALEAQFDQSTLFIGGAFGEISQRPGVITVERTVVLPSDGILTIFLPLLNGNFDNVVKEPGQGGQSVEQLRDFAHMVFNPTAQGGYVSDLFASVDGKKVKDLLGYRQATDINASFLYTTPYPIENSLISSYGVTGDWYLDNVGSSIQLSALADGGDSVTIGPDVSDGYWLAVDVAGGGHTLNFGGTLSDDQGPFFALDIAYNVLNPIYGTSEKDILTGSDDNDYVDGGLGRDYLFGDKGDDLLVGGGGKDVIDGGKGNDELWGDAGRDQFIFKKGYGEDMIFDFTSGEKVKTSNFRKDPVKSDVEVLGKVGATQFDFGGGDILTFVGLQSDDLLFQRGLITFV